MNIKVQTHPPQLILIKFSEFDENEKSVQLIFESIVS